MEITIRNITKDRMVDFKNDHSINLPMEEKELRRLLGKGEWIIVDSPIGEELTNILELNDLLTQKDEEVINILDAAGYLLSEIKDGNFAIVDFSADTLSTSR